LNALLKAEGLPYPTRRATAAVRSSTASLGRHPVAERAVAVEVFGDLAGSDRPDTG
jgi:hypothetical protein